MKRDTKDLVSYYVRKFGTRNPFEIAKNMGIVLQIGPLGNKCGCYMFLKNHRCIFLNEDLSETEKKLVMAHELAHAILHRKENCYFIRNKTLFLNSKKEIEANKFAVELLIDEDTLKEYKEFTTEQLSRLLGYDRKLIELRMK